MVTARNVSIDDEVHKLVRKLNRDAEFKAFLLDSQVTAEDKLGEILTRLIVKYEVIDPHKMIMVQRKLNEEYHFAKVCPHFVLEQESQDPRFYVASCYGHPTECDGFNDPKKCEFKKQIMELSPLQRKHAVLVARQLNQMPYTEGI